MFHNRLMVESDVRQQTVSQMEILQRTLQQREQELQEARDNIKQPLSELTELQRNATGWWNQLQDMTKRLLFNCKHYCILLHIYTIVKHIKTSFNVYVC